MYEIIGEDYEEPIKGDEPFGVYEVDDININPCPCMRKRSALEVWVPYVSIKFHWNIKQIHYWGDNGGAINIKYCPFCGRKL